MGHSITDYPATSHNFIVVPDQSPTSHRSVGDHLVSTETYIVQVQKTARDYFESKIFDDWLVTGQLVTEKSATSQHFILVCDQLPTSRRLVTTETSSQPKLATAHLLCRFKRQLATFLNCKFSAIGRRQVI